MLVQEYLSEIHHCVGLRDHIAFHRSAHIETGVLGVYAVALKEQPTQLRFFKIYADEAAYRQHIDSSHFKKYVESTKSMTTSRRLLEAEPILLDLPSR